MGNANPWGHVHIIKCVKLKCVKMSAAMHKLPLHWLLAQDKCPRCRLMKTCSLGDDISADDPGYDLIMVTP